MKLNGDVKKLCVIVAVAGIVLTILLGIRSYCGTFLQNGNELPRYQAGEGSYEQRLTACTGIYGKIPIEIEVSEQKLNTKEIEKALEAAVETLPEYLAGDNQSLDQVTENLNFIKKIPGTTIKIEWQTEPEAFDYFNADLTLREDTVVTNPVKIPVAAVLTLEKVTKKYETVITLIPRELTAEQKLAFYVAQASGEADTTTSEVLSLPKSYEGEQITWRKKADLTFLYFPALTVVAVLALVLGRKKDEEDTEKKERLEMERDYAEVVSKFTMLLSTGMTVKNAWERIVLLYEKQKSRDKEAYRKKRIYEEMGCAFHELQQGISEPEVYERFGKRTGLIHYKKLMGMFVQNMRKGTVNLLAAMDLEMLEAWEEKKRRVRQEGEIIGTKLLFPMMGMMSMIFIIIMVPAFLSFF